MPRNFNATSLAILKPTMELLKTHKHIGQSYDGFINELLDEHRQGAIILSPGTIKRLEEYRSNPKESIDTLIQAVLDELETKINNIGAK